MLTALQRKDLDPEQPALHASAVAEKLGDWDAVIQAIESVETAAEHAVLMIRLTRAGLTGGRRELGLAALCQLCWRQPEAAAVLLDRCEDPPVSRRLESFWDLEPPLPTELFPAWLLAGGHPMPEIRQISARTGPRCARWRSYAACASTRLRRNRANGCSGQSRCFSSTG